MKRHALGEVGWAAGGQIATALGALLGVRLLTEFLSPDTFGVVTLAMGIALLALNTACIPFTQAATRFYPDLAATDGIGRLRSALDLSLRKVARGFLVVTLGTAGLSLLYAPHLFIIVMLIAVLVACDCARSIELAFLNAAREQKRYALWIGCDAVFRPVAACGAVLMFGESAAVVLVAYVIASVVLQLIFGSFFSRRPANPAPREDEVAATELRVWQYALPLIPLGIVGWTSGLADRYIISGMLSLADAGIYAAVYGLASRAFLSLGQALELLARPVYQNAVSAGHTVRARSLFVRWVGLVAAAGVLGVTLITFAREEIAALLLAESFRHGAVLLPWIAAGYALRTLADVFTRVCYAHGRTGFVFLLTLSGSIAGLAATAIGTHYWGLIGAAMAVPVYFSVQLVAAMLAARATHRKAAAEPRRMQWLA
jgi:O-antigen/teichoic acid export membrane protein